MNTTTAMPAAPAAPVAKTAAITGHTIFTAYARVRGTKADKRYGDGSRWAHATIWGRNADGSKVIAQYALATKTSNGRQTVRKWIDAGNTNLSAAELASLTARELF